MANVAALTARVLLSMIFIEAGLSGLGNLGGGAPYFEGLGLPFPHLAAWAVPPFEFVAGACLLLGLATRPAALLLGGFAIAAASFGHLGQGGGDPALAAMHWQAFMKDIAIAGGLVALAALGPGRFSTDAWRKGAQAG